MVTLVFENDSKEQALNLRDRLHEHLVGIPAYIDNQIILTSGTPNREDGEMEFDVNGETRKHCILLTLSDPNIKSDEELVLTTKLN